MCVLTAGLEVPIPTSPELVIVKERAPGTGSWYVQTTLIDGSLDYLLLESTAAKGNLNSYAANLTATTFPSMQIGVGDTQDAYCFHSVDGYSKVGSYTGNGNADGTFVYTGFRPAMVIRKRATDATGHWNINDNKRIGYNGSGSNGVLYPNATYTEADTDRVDLLSNGFKVRTVDTDVNASGSTFIYIAFAETPFKYSNAR